MKEEKIRRTTPTRMRTPFREGQMRLLQTALFEGARKGDFSLSGLHVKEE